MTFPQSVETVSLTVGPLYHAGGKLREGVRLTATLSTVVRFTEGGGMLPSFVSAVTDSTGTATLTLVASDSEGIDRAGFTYRISCPQVLQRPVDVAFPADVATVAVESLEDTDQTDGSLLWLPVREAALAAQAAAEAASAAAQISQAAAAANAAVILSGLVLMGPDDPGSELPVGTEYVWIETDGAGAIVDIHGCYRIES